MSLRRKVYVWLFLVLLGLEVYALWKLKKLPNSHVSVINTSEETLFNAPPNQEMVAEIAGNNFYYRIPSPYLEQYRRALATIMAENKQGEWEKALAIARWVRGKIRYGEPNPKKSYFGNTWSDSAIVDDSIVFPGECNSYSELLTIGCLSVGIPARFIWLRAHSVVEVFLQEQKKWVMVDPAYGFYAKVEGLPASCLAIRKSFQDGSYGAKWEPIVFDITKDDHSYLPEMEQNFQMNFLGIFQAADANFTLQTPGWHNFFRLYQVLNWVDVFGGPQGIWEYRLRWFVGINFLVLVVFFIFLILNTNKQSSRKNR